MLLSTPVKARASRRSERAVLYDLRIAVERATAELDPDSSWMETLTELRDELKEGQPFFFKLDLASSKRSQSETPVVFE